MVRLLAFIALLIAAPAAYSQSEKSSADSLTRLLASSAKEDSNKVKLLLELYRHILPANTDSALKISQQISTISARIDFSYGLIKGLNCRAVCYWYQNNPGQAIPTFHKALARAMKDNNIDLETMVLSNLGIYYGVLGVSDSAEKYHKLAVNCGKQLQDKSRYAKAVSDLATVYFNKGNYIGAIQNTLESQAIYEAKHMNSFLANSYIKLGMIYFDLNDFEKSMSAYRMALKINKPLGDIKLDMAIFLNMGFLYSQVKGDQDSARIFLKKVLRMAEENKVEETHLNALINLGNIAMTQKDFKTALQYFSDAYKSPLIPYRNQQRAALLVNLGGVYFELGDLEKAEKFTKSGLQLAHDQEFVTFEKSACKIMGDIEAKKGSYKAAFEY
ncbi:MAG: tetratricopeptide repeat protein, partial [Bacteroidales bacterium]